MEREPGDGAERRPQYSLRQLWVAVLICCLAIHVGLTAAGLLALIAAQAICFMLIELLFSAGEPADPHITVGETPRFSPFEQNE